MSPGYHLIRVYHGTISTMQLIDTHTHLHLQQFDHDRAETLERAAMVGVARMIEIGYDIASSQAAIALAEEHTEIFAVVGIQPNHAIEAPDGWLEQIRQLASHPKVVAIGEIGLDYYWNKAPAELQASVFRAQLGLARDLDLPVVIHSRDAQEDTIQILRNAARGQPGIMHSFSGDWAYAEACLEVGFLLSFSGPVTFTKAAALHEVARRVPAQSMLTETDCPFLAPHPRRGKRNEPAHVRLVVEQLARLRNQTSETIAETVWANANRIFQLSLG
jgi:TatD DNase family protein